MDAPPISTGVLRFFRRIVRGYFKRHFHGVRVSGAEGFSELGKAAKGPLLVYANHSSWWDPMVCFLLAERLMASRKHYAPMEAGSLQRYGILRKVGVFPVELNSARGAAQFLRAGDAIANEGGVLWVTPQGRFSDARERPLEFKPGLAALAARLAAKHGRCTVIPLAIEYVFWNERLPETLLHFGDPVEVEAGEQTEGVGARLTAALESSMQRLQGLAMTRDAGRFEVLLDGRRGMGGFYALGKRISAFARGRAYLPEHTPAELRAIPERKR